MWKVLKVNLKKYKILQNTLISLIKSSKNKDITTIDKIISVTASLINLTFNSLFQLLHECNC